MSSNIQEFILIRSIVWGLLFLISPIVSGLARPRASLREASEMEIYHGCHGNASEERGGCPRGSWRAAVLHLGWCVRDFFFNSSSLVRLREDNTTLIFGSFHNKQQLMHPHCFVYYDKTWMKTVLTCFTEMIAEQPSLTQYKQPCTMMKEKLIYMLSSTDKKFMICLFDFERFSIESRFPFFFKSHCIYNVHVYILGTFNNKIYDSGKISENLNRIRCMSLLLNSLSLTHVKLNKIIKVLKP